MPLSCDLDDEDAEDPQTVVLPQRQRALLRMSRESARETPCRDAVAPPPEPTLAPSATSEPAPLEPERAEPPPPAARGLPAESSSLSDRGQLLLGASMAAGVAVVLALLVVVAIVGMVGGLGVSIAIASAVG